MHYDRQRLGLEIELNKVLARTGVQKADVARVLGRSRGHVSRIFSTKPQHDDYRIHASDLPELHGLLGNDLWPAVDALLEEMGRRTIPLPSEEPMPLDDGLLELDVALGHVKEAFLAARKPDSQGGRLISRTERIRLKEKLEAARRDLDAMVEGLREEASA